MPDPTKQTVSASQVPAVFGVSPWATRWTLWHEFAGSPVPDDEEKIRMTWGKLLQPAILAMTAQELGAEVIANHEYYSAPERCVGATADGYVLDPNYGLGWVESKAVSTWNWRDAWTETEAPLYVELQHQTQLMVPHPEHGMPKWGLIAAKVDLDPIRLFRRKPDPAVQTRISDMAREFLKSVREGDEPDADGQPIEIPQLLALYPEAVPTKVLEFEPGSAEHEVLRRYEHWSDQEKMAKKESDRAKAELLAIAKDAGRVVIPDILNVKLGKSEIAEATITRKAHVRTTITVKRLGPDKAEPSEAETPLASG